MAWHGHLVLSDRGIDAEHAAIPILLAVGAVHHDLIRAGLRMAVDIVCRPVRSGMSTVSPVSLGTAHRRFTRMSPCKQLRPRRHSWTMST